MTVDSPIFWAEELIDHQELRKFYESRGVRCFACCAAEIETFAQGAKVHSGGPYGTFDAAKLVAELNDLAARAPFTPGTAYNGSLLARALDWLFPGKGGG